MIYYEGREKACNFTVRMPQIMRDQIQEVADKEHITSTFYIRSLIEKDLRERKLNTDKTSA